SPGAGTWPGSTPIRAGVALDALPTLDGRDAAATAIAGEPGGPTAGSGEAPPLPIVPEGHYKPDREIARGGMGRIVAAEDQRLGRRVALKELLEPAGEQLSRFQREALITARLQHPGIVPVYEAGRWPTGEPFFAMKLVSGRPLDRVIADARSLDERLALLPRIAAAADAIAYAHSQRVVHRDLKPANVLIGDFGETVVIDWGLAKDLDAGDGPASQPAFVPTSTLPSGPRAKKSGSGRRASRSTEASTLTVAGAVMGTPAYMAPEQARGEPVDQRADVFALGAMLYHLLAGVPPYNARTATDVIAAAALGKVVPLDERERRAPQELVAIVERAMAQVPGDRYENAGELAEEVRRFMTGQLVSAHRYTALQRVTRFVKRHRAAVAISIFAAITIAVGGTVAVRRIVEERDNADRERTLAVTRQKAAEKLIDEVLDDMKERLAKIGRIDLMTNLGGEIRTYYKTLSKVPGGMPTSDLDRMARAVDLVGLAERDSGEPDRALETWTVARSLLAGAVGADLSPATLFKRAMIARLDFRIGTIHQLRGENGPANAAYAKAKAEYEALLGEAPADHQILIHAAENLDQIGDLRRNVGKLGDALREYTEARSLRQRASSQTASRPSEETIELSTSHLKIGSIHQARGESALALTEYGEALRLLKAQLASRPDDVDVKEKVLKVQDALADLHRLLGDLKRAAETYQEAILLWNGLVQRDPQNTEWKRRRGITLADLGFTLLDSGDFKSGLEQLDRAIESQQQLTARDPKNTAWIMDLSQSYTRAGDGYIYIGVIDEGIARYNASLELRSKLAQREPAHAPYPRSVAWAYSKLGNAYASKNELPRALEAHEKALEIRAKLVGDAPSQVGFTNELASSEVTLGRLLIARDRKRAGELIAAGLERARALVAADAINAEWKRTLVQGLLARAELAGAAGDRDARKAALAGALAISTAAADHAPQSVHWAGFAAEAQAGLAEVAAAAGDPAGAAAAWKAVRERLEPLASAGRLP
ncbi:MAG TPA: serine/threonine-protein kinase, partial [Kofleriaceae bacterium]|nr:serine/threonine-protein kinase [Kofleriaceae bacterium]